MTKTVKPAQEWTHNKILFTAFAARVCLVLYAHIHDYFFQVNFTDVDYLVFSDAAKHVAAGRSPYDRATYRYTPALAWLLIPNKYAADFGKILFCAADIAVAWLLFRIGQHLTLPKADMRLPITIFWLANPFTAIISSRGNSDSLVCASVLLVLYFLQHRKVLYAALAQGLLAVHLKIYPVIYLPSVYLFILANYGEQVICQRTKDVYEKQGLVRAIRSLISFHGIAFCFISSFSFGMLVTIFFALYGNTFLHEYLLYHIGRRDIRHNFSPYFLVLYLAESEEFWSKCVSLAAFVPQAASVVIFALRFYNDLPFCWFVTTFAFVAFNKVVTSQYFIWFIVFLPLIAQSVQISISRATSLIALWFCGQGVWLFFAYLLEFQGLDVYLYVWLASLLFLVINAFVLRDVIRNYKPPEAISSCDKKEN